MPEKSQTSAIKYSRDFAIPEDFPALLRDLTREILRAQPADINKFAYEYFLKMQQDVAMTQATEEEF